MEEVGTERDDGLKTLRCKSLRNASLPLGHDNDVQILHRGGEFSTGSVPRSVPAIADQSPIQTHLFLGGRYRNRKLLGLQGSQQMRPWKLGSDCRFSTIDETHSGVKRICNSHP